MILLALLAALLVGAALGARGFHRLGRTARGLRGPWRPGAGFGAALLLFAALALLARGEWLPGAALLAAALALAGVASRRRTPRSQAEAPTSFGLSRREAAALLGVPETASRGEVEAAHRRLMRWAHPDAGGAAGLAAQLNAAREALLRSR